MENKSGNGLSFLAKCEKCGVGFEVNNPVLKQMRTEIERQSIWLTYYDCPMCGNRHYVQVDNLRSREMLRDCKKMFVRMSAKRSRREDIPQKQLDKFQQARQHLSEYRTALMKELTGKAFTDTESGEVLDLRFSV